MAEVAGDSGGTTGNMKPVVDKMFPEGTGPHMDLDEAASTRGS